MSGSPQPTDLAMFYGRAPIILWVEDRLTREYLGELWGNPTDVAFYVAGGESGVRSMVADATGGGFRHVSGIVDREFRDSNIDRWPSLREQGVACRLPRFEIENYLLDPEALAACASPRTPRTSGEIAMRIRTEAAGMVWWMACGDVRSGMYGAFAHGFPETPARNAASGYGRGRMAPRSREGCGSGTAKSRSYPGRPRAGARPSPGKPMRRAAPNPRPTAPSIRELVAWLGTDRGQIEGAAVRICRGIRLA